MNIENTFNLIPRDILNRKHDKAKTRLLEIYDSLSQIGTNAMRAENKEHLVNVIQMTFEKICEEAQKKRNCKHNCHVSKMFQVVMHSHFLFTCKAKVLGI
jgi:hypothetical protein